MQIGGYRERPRVQISGKREISPNPCNNRLEEIRSQFNLSIIIPSAGGEREAKNARKITLARETRMHGGNDERGRLLIERIIQCLLFQKENNYGS